MNGKINLDIRFGKLQYYFELVRNITIINDDSATGKSTLVKNLSDRDDIGYSSVEISSGGYQVLTLNKDSWKAAQFMPELYKDSIIFIDEMQYFIDTSQFSKFVKDTGSYFVLITRSDIENLSYSVKEIYSLDIKGNKHTLKSNLKKKYLEEGVTNQILENNYLCFKRNDSTNKMTII